MPAQPIYSSLVLCEKVLQESDGVVSAVRIVDIFYVSQTGIEVPPEHRAVLMQMFFQAKFPATAAVGEEHAVELILERPNGESGNVATSDAVRLVPSKVDGPKGISVVARFGVIPRQMGTHYLVILLDGKEVQRAPFTLAEAPEPEDE